MASTARALLLSSLLVGCHGESVESGPAMQDAASEIVTDAPVDSADVADAADATTDAGVCTSVAGNAVENASFELAPGGKVTAWRGATDVVLTQRLGGAAHCAAWLEVSFPAASVSFPTWVGQDMNFDPVPLKGSTVTATMWARSLDGDVSGHFRVGVLSGSYSSKGITLPSDGTWKQFSITWTLPDEDLHILSVGFISESTTARKIGLDHVTFIVTS